MDRYDAVSVLEVDHCLQQRLSELLRRVCTEHQARAAFLVEACGRPIAMSHALESLDSEALASLTAAAAAAAGQLAQLLGEEDASVVLQRGSCEVLELTPAGNFVLAVLFGAESPQGLERLRARLRRKRALTEIHRLLAALTTPQPGDAPLRELDDAELEQLLAPVTTAT